MTAAHIHATGLGVTFGATSVLDDVDVLAQGGIIAVLGANGAGKTTLLRSVATLLRPNAGSVSVDGLNPTHERERIEIRRRLGYVPQRIGFGRSVKVFDALDYVAVLKEHHHDRRRRQLVFEALERVGLRDRVSDRVNTLSGGMQQRLGLAQAILGSPTLLILDEPTAGLDPDERMRFREILAERRRSATVFVSTHLTDDAADADTVMVLADKGVRFTGSPAQLADVARGRTWLQHGFPPPGVRASWRQADGRYRCLAVRPPTGTSDGSVQLVEPRLEDGYLLLNTSA